MDKTAFLKSFALVALLSILFLPAESGLWRLGLLLGIPAGFWWFIRIA